MHYTAGKGGAQGQTVGLSQGHRQKAAGVLVQTVNNAGPQPFQLGQLRKTRQQALHQGMFRTGRAGVHSKPGGFVAHCQVFVVPENFQMPLFSPQGRACFRRLKFHHLPLAQAAVRLVLRKAVNPAVPGFDGLLQGRTRNSGQFLPQYPVQALPRSCGRDAHVQRVHRRVSAGVDRVRSLSAKVTVR